jgi:Protein of unknown function (DUF3828)
VCFVWVSGSFLNAMAKPRSLIIVITLCLFVTWPMTTAATPVAILSPEAVVAALYKQHKKASPFFQHRSRALLDKYFDKPLANLLWKDATTVRDEVGALDGDPLYNAQDMEIKNFAIGKAVVNAGSAEVKVTFQNFDRNEVITFDLVMRKPGWKIADIKYADGTTLAGILKQNP